LKKKNRKSKVVAHEIEEALDWWSRNDSELDEEASPAEDLKMKRLESLAQCWYQLAHPDSTRDSGSNLAWFRNQDFAKDVSDAIKYEGSTLRLTMKMQHLLVSWPKARNRMPRMT
jgi:hypothetical protein